MMSAWPAGVTRKAPVAARASPAKWVILLNLFTFELLKMVAKGRDIPLVDEAFPEIALAFIVSCDPAGILLCVAQLEIT